MIENRRGYFGIGIFSPKTSENVGTLWRSAYQLGASFIFVIEKRYKSQPSDTYKSYRHIPLLQFKTLSAFVESPIYDCRTVCVDFGDGSEDLRGFVHPERAVYILGSEDNGLPNELTRDKRLLSIPSARNPSYNVAMAGTIVMYDRLMKSL